MKPRWLLPVAALCFALVTLSVYLILFRVPNEIEQGLIFKIFFFHVPAAWLLLLSGLVCAGGAISHLFGNPRGDAVAVAAGELAFLFGALVMVTGPIWASRAWGKAWVWEPRLTTSLVCWLTFVVYVFVRRMAPPSLAPRISSVLAIFGAINVPIVYLSVKLWGRGLHPPTSVVKTLEPSMRVALYVSGAAFIVLWALLFGLRISHEEQVAELDRLYVESET